MMLLSYALPLEVAVPQFIIKKDNTIMNNSTSWGYLTAIMTAMLCLTAASGEPASVPSFTGNISIDKAMASIEARDDLEIGSVLYEYNRDIPRSRVLSQTPPADTIIEEGQAMTVNLVVSQGPRPYVSAGIGWDQNYGVAPLEVTFSDSSVSNVNPIIEWTWDLGDGSKSTEPNPKHTYTTPGVYSVSLTVTTDTGETDSETREDAIIVIAVDRADIGPEGGSISTPDGASYSVAPGMFSDKITVAFATTPDIAIRAPIRMRGYERIRKTRISDTQENIERTPISPNMPYHGSVTTVIEPWEVIDWEKYQATVIIPLSEKLDPGMELDFYVRRFGYGHWFFQEEKAVVNENGDTATLTTNQVGTLIVCVPDEFLEVVTDKEGRFRLIVRPNLLRPYLEHYQPDANEAHLIGPPLSELFSHILPREITLLARSDLPANKINLTLFANESPGGPHIQTQINNANVLDRVPGVNWVSDGLELRDGGMLAAEGTLPFPEHYKESRLLYWTPQIQDPPPSIGGGHLVELAVDNVNGDMLTLFAVAASFLSEDWVNIFCLLFPEIVFFGEPSLTPDCDELSLMAALSVYIVNIYIVQLFADVRDSGAVELSLSISVPTDIGPAFVQAFSWSISNRLSQWLKEKYSLILDGALRWEQTEKLIMGTYTLSGMAPILNDIISATTTLFADSGVLPDDPPLMSTESQQ